MLQPKKVDERWVRIGTRKYIPEVRCDGPVVTPIKIPAEMVLQILNRLDENKNETIVEVNPKTKKEIILNRQNIFDPNRFGKVELPKAPQPKEHQHVAPKAASTVKVEQPVIGKKEEPVKVEEVNPIVVEPPVVEDAPVVEVVEEVPVVEEEPVVPSTTVEIKDDSQNVVDSTPEVTTVVNDNSQKNYQNTNKNKNKNVRK